MGRGSDRRSGTGCPTSIISTPRSEQNRPPAHRRDYISHSAISTFQRCPLKDYFSYVAGLTPEFVSSSLVFGGAIHSAIELHFRRGFEGAAPPTLDELVAAYELAWNSETAIPIQFGKAESVASLRDLAHRMLAAFQAAGVSRMDSTILAIEDEFRAPIIPGCPDFLGRIDLVALNRSALRTIDFKTSRTRRRRDARGDRK